MIGAALAAGLLGTLGSLGGQYLLNQQQQSFNAREAQKQRDFEAQMSNSAYQRSIADMQAAGVNPNMALGSGGPASTPSGVAASASNGSFSASFPGLSSAFLAAAAKDKNLAQSFFYSERAKAAANAMEAEREARNIKNDLLVSKSDYFNNASAYKKEQAHKLHDENIRKDLSSAEEFKRKYLPFAKW